MACAAWQDTIGPCRQVVGRHIEGRPGAPLTHREKDFWLHVAAYLSLGCAFVMIVLAIFDFAIVGRKADLSGAAIFLMMGANLLIFLQTRKTDKHDGR